jgi:hypothetical protein
MLDPAARAVGPPRRLPYTNRSEKNPIIWIGYRIDNPSLFLRRSTQTGTEGLVEAADGQRHTSIRSRVALGASLLLLVGEVLLSASLPPDRDLAFAGLADTVCIPLGEEPGLVGSVGYEGFTYERNVPRWVPRRIPWEIGTGES